MTGNHQLAAIMFTDIVGFTILMGADEVKTMAILKKNRKIHQTQIKNYNGRLLKEMGDGMLASFTSVSEAVFCAGAIQTAAKEQEINLKIGIHEGEVVFQDNDIFGDGVNIASRIEALAVTGEILLSDSAYKNIRNKEGIQAEFVKEETLKNVDEPVRIYRVREVISEKDTRSGYTYSASVPSSLETKSGSKRKALLATIGTIGLYLVASWGIIQIVEWLVGHYPISPNWGQFSLVTLLSMLPTVILLAYFQGKPGFVRGTRFKKIGIPANLLSSAVLRLFRFQKKDLGAATAAISFQDEEGNTVERMIPKSEFRHRITVFAFENESGDSTLNWLQYGFMDLLDFDLDQVLYLDIWSWTNIDEFKQAGFNEAIGAPLTLQRKIAIDDHFRYFVTGSFTKQNDIFSIKTTLYETQRGKPIAENSLAGSDIFQLVDSMSVQLMQDLKIPAYYLDKTEDLPVSEQLTNSIPALRSFISGIYESTVHNEYQAAVKHYENALKEDPGFAYAHYVSYELFRDLNQRDRAENSIRAAMQYRYKLPELWQFFVKNAYYEIQGDWQSAFENSRHWVELYPNATHGRYKLAEHYRRMNQPDMAIAEYTRILEIEPESHWNLRNIGDLLSRKGDYNEALKYYEHYANLYPNEPLSFTEIGGLYSTMGDHEQAKVYYKKALLIEPENSGIVTELANTERYLGNFEQALVQYGKALNVAKSPQERRTVYEALSNYFEFRGQIDKAIEYWDLNVAEMQKFASPIAILMDGKMDYIGLYILAGKEDMALKIVKEFEAQAHQLGPPFNQVPFLFDLTFNIIAEDPEMSAVLEEEFEKFEAFIQTYNWEDQRWVIWAGHGVLAEYREEYSQAIAGFQKAAEMVTELEFKVGLRISIGYCYRKLKEFEEAKETLQEALKLEPFSPPVHYELALVYWEQDEKEQAMEHLKTALNVWEEADAGYQPAKEAREKLTEWELVTKSN